MVTRQLVSYKASYAAGASGTVVPDMATWTVSPNGLSYTFHIKQGVMWDAPSGARQVTSQDEERGIKRLCNPVSGAPPYPVLVEQHRRDADLLLGVPEADPADLPHR